MNSEPGPEHVVDHARKDEILVQLTGYMRQKVVRRRRRRAFTIIVCMLAGSAAVVWRMSGPVAHLGVEQQIEPSPIAGDVHTRPEPPLPDTPGPLSPSPHIVVMGNDARILERMSVSGRANVEVINPGASDAELVQMLREAGIEEGVIRMGGRLQLARDVVGAPLGGRGGLGGRPEEGRSGPQSHRPGDGASLRGGVEG